MTEGEQRYLAQRIVELLEAPHRPIGFAVETVLFWRWREMAIEERDA